MYYVIERFRKDMGVCKAYGPHPKGKAVALMEELKTCNPQWWYELGR